MHHEPRLHFDYPGHRRSAYTDQHSQREQQRSQRDRPSGTATTTRREPSKLSPEHHTRPRHRRPRPRVHPSGCITRAILTSCPRETKTRPTTFDQHYKTSIIVASSSKQSDSTPVAWTLPPFSLFASSQPFININDCPRPEGR